MGSLTTTDHEPWAPDFIGQLCIALAHRWDPERLFVILTSYFDESGTHDESPVTVMAGIMGTAAQWGRFQIGLNRLKRRHGFKTFHATEFKKRSGEFSGWSPERCVEMLFDLTALAEKTVMEGVTFPLNNADYDQQYRGTETPRRVRLDTKYGLCFRVCLIHLVSEAVRRLGPHKTFAESRMHVVMESGHRHAGDAERVFNEEKKELEGLGCNLLSSITFAGKDCDPLMVADFISHTTHMRSVRKEAPVPRIPFPLPSSRARGLVHLEFQPDGLAMLKESIVQQIVQQRRSQATIRRDASAPGGDPYTVRPKE